jgi:hypothetical protein
MKTYQQCIYFPFFCNLLDRQPLFLKGKDSRFILLILVAWWRGVVNETENICLWKGRETLNEWMKFKFVSAFTTVSMFESARQKTIVYHTLKWLWKVNVFRLHLKMSISVSLLRDIGKKFQSRGAQVEKALPPNDLSLKDCSDRRCFDSRKHLWVETPEKPLFLWMNASDSPCFYERLFQSNSKIYFQWLGWLADALNCTSALPIPFWRQRSPLIYAMIFGWTCKLRIVGPTGIFLWICARHCT